MGRLIWILLCGGIGVALGMLLGASLLSQWAPGPGEGGDKFGANVLVAGLGGAFLGGIAGGIGGGILGNVLGKRQDHSTDDDPTRGRE